MIKKDIPQQYFSFSQKVSNIYSKYLISYLFKNKKIYESFLKTKIIILKIKNLWNMPNNMNIIDDLDNFTRKDLPVFDLVDKKNL